jgi:hypothetical protein
MLSKRSGGKFLLNQVDQIVNSEGTGAQSLRRVICKSRVTL